VSDPGVPSSAAAPVTPPVTDRGQPAEQLPGGSEGQPGRLAAAARDAPGAGKERSGVLVLGGTSEIAEAIVRELALDRACDVVLAGRDEAALGTVSERLRAAGCASAEVLGGLDASAVASHRAILARAFELLGQVDLVIVAVGVLGERGGLPDDIAAALEVLEVNVVGSSSLVMESARALREQGGGTLVVLSSLAAERPRRANAVYSASKAALDGLSQGLADALRPAGVRILVVRPGFVHTRMTSGLPTPPFACSPQTVAQATVRGLNRGAQTVWAPPALRWAGVAMRLMPRPLFRRLSL
jgi:decaprenylphospho-beta-D-erythro-pentofuranosid-2-ulose 2-reductase